MEAAENSPKEPQHPATGFGVPTAPPPPLRGAPPRPPTLQGRHAAAEEARQTEHKGREAAERRSMLRGLLLIAGAVLVLAVLQFGWARAFPAGWWRRW